MYKISFGYQKQITILKPHFNLINSHDHTYIYEYFYVLYQHDTDYKYNLTISTYSIRHTHSAFGFVVRFDH